MIFLVFVSLEPHINHSFTGKILNRIVSEELLW